MIINQLVAENVLKYVRLELRNLPTPGVIAISGSNESGKSAIGETICLALFGRTFSLAQGDFAKLIRWGESRCKVLLEFTLDGDRYELTRHVDDEGNEGGSLTLAGSDSPLATGKKHLEQALNDLLGFGFEEFTESFYLAQREITTPHPHGAAVKAMAGIAQLESVSERLEEEIDVYAQDIGDSEQSAAEIGRQITDLSFNEETLAALEREFAEVSDKVKQDELRQSELDENWNRWQKTKLEIRGGTEGLLAAGPEFSLQQWREALGQLEPCLDRLHKAVEGSHEPASALTDIDAFARELDADLSKVDVLASGSQGYRSRLAHLLGELSSSRPGHAGGGTARGDTAEAELSFAERRERLSAEMARRGRHRLLERVGLAVFALFTLTAGAVWMLLHLMPDLEVSQALAAWLSQNVSGWESVYGRFLPVAAGALASVTIILLLSDFYLGSRIRRLRGNLRELARQEEVARREAELVDGLETTPLNEAVARLGSIDDEQVSVSVTEFRESAGVRLLDEDPAGVHTVLPGLMAEYETAMDAESERMASHIATCLRDIEMQKTRLSNLSQEISSEQQRQKTANELHDRSATLEAEIHSFRRSIDERRLARELIAGACRSISKRFNRELRTVAGSILPLFTNGRYEHLQIDEQLSVRAFSNEKRNFMALEEISIGTQRQIMLAVRLAMSKELIGKTHGKSQFLFLDEPFAFFDEERMRAALEALPALGEHFAQVWVTAQHFPLGAAYDMHVECSSEMEELSVAPN